MFAREHGKRVSRLRIPNVNGRIFSNLSRRDNILVLFSVVHSHGNDVVGVLQIEFLRAETNMVDDTGTSGWIDNRFVVGQVE